MAKEFNCCFASSIPLRCQLFILIVVCAVVFLGAAPVIITLFKDRIGLAFENNVILGNLQRSISAIDTVIQHEENMMVADAVWDAMADQSQDMIDSGSTEEFYKFIKKNLFNYEVWSDWACGNMLAVYDRVSPDADPVHIFSEFHLTNPDTLVMDLHNATKTPDIFLGETEESKQFLRNVTSKERESTMGLIAIEEGVFCVTCHSIMHVDPSDTPHGWLCRAMDLRRYLDDIASSSGACFSLYNLASNSTDDMVRKEFGSLSLGRRTSENKYEGNYSIYAVVKGEWEYVPWPIRHCGPAELLNANSSRRTSLSYRLPSDFGFDEGKTGDHFGFAVTIDCDREFEPRVDETFLVADLFLVIFGLILFIVYGLFTEFRVIHNLEIISKAAYKSFVKHETGYQEYYKKKGKKDDDESSNKNVIFQMATIAAMTITKNMKQLEMARNDLHNERILSSLIVDELRLLSLHCSRTVPFLEHHKKKDKRKRRSGVGADAGLILKENVTYERVINDPFCIEMFKNFSVEDPKTGKICYPARRALLFLLSVLYYRSMSETTTIRSRVNCVKGILDEFFTSPTSNSGSPLPCDDEGELGIPESMVIALNEDCKHAMANRKLGRNLFDESAAIVREYLKKDIFPQFVKSDAFTIVRIVLAQASKIHRRKDDMDDDDDDADDSRLAASATAKRFGKSSGSVSNRTANSAKSGNVLQDIVNDTEGTKLSHQSFKIVTSTLFG